MGLDMKNPDEDFYSKLVAGKRRGEVVTCAANILRSHWFESYEQAF